MKNLKSISDAELLHDTHELAARERELGLEVIHHLTEVKARKLFAARGFGSLFEYAVKDLKYSEAAAHRRVETVKALERNPELEEKIESGALNLTVVASAQRFFRHEEKVAGPVDRAEVFAALENKSTREAERELLARSSNPATLNSERIVAKTEELVEVRFMIEREFENDLQTLRGLLAHRNPNLSLRELMHEMMRVTLAQLSPAREPKRKAKTRSDGPTPERPQSQPASQPNSQREQEPHDSPLPAPETRAPRRPPAATVRKVWQRAHSRCEFAGCDSCFGLEVDHVIPVAKGGTHALENLRLLCFQHNQYEAERILGREFMQSRRPHPRA